VAGPQSPEVIASTSHRQKTRALPYVFRFPPEQVSNTGAAAGTLRDRARLVKVAAATGHADRPAARCATPKGVPDACPLGRVPIRCPNPRGFPVTAGDW
jgi:hypothetical protein